jgi:uncharacterized coiled-coil DUF342 family protein
MMEHKTEIERLREEIARLRMRAETAERERDILIEQADDDTDIIQITIQERDEARARVKELERAA